MSKIEQTIAHFISGMEFLHPIFVWLLHISGTILKVGLIFITCW